jgi:hypothetical protein
MYIERMSDRGRKGNIVNASCQRQHLMRSSLILTLSTLALSGHVGSAGATLVKCRTDAGTAVYQDAPCRPGMELRNFDTDPATLSIVPFAPAAPPLTQPVPARPPAARTARRQPQGRLVSEKEASERRFIRTGMTESEVVRRIGKPEVDASGGRNKRKDSKRWSYLPAPGDPDTITTVTIVAGQVADVERKIVR